MKTLLHNGQRAPEIACVYRNLKHGTAWDAHTWSVCLPRYKQDGTVGAGLGKLQGRTKSIVLLAARARYKGDKLRSTIAQTRKREVFAWFEGMPADHSAMAFHGLVKGRRIGMNVKAHGEVAFCYADDRSAAPSVMAGLLFTTKGLFELTQGAYNG